MKRFTTILLCVLALLLGTYASAQAPCPQCGGYHGYTQPSSSGGVYNVVNLLNRQRAAWGGLYPYQPDARLQRIAERRVRILASMGRFRGHPPGVQTAEGCGFTSSQNPTAVNACLTYSSKYRYVGAAMIKTSRGCYFMCCYR